jgi:hypothetical protein
VKLVPLPALEPDPGSAVLAVTTPAGHTLVSLAQGTMVRLEAGKSSWEPFEFPALQGLVVDEQGTNLGINTAGLVEVLDDELSALAMPVPPAAEGYRAIRGRDANGRFWFTAGAYADASTSTLFVGHWAPGEESWTSVFTSIPHEHALPVNAPVFTGAGGLFFRPAEAGVWEIEPTTAVTREVVSCTHEMFRPSHPDYAACQQDTVLFRGPDHDAWAINAMFEVWRIPAGGAPKRVVAGEPPGRVLKDGSGGNFFAIQTVSPWVAPDGTLWLAFRWGDNSGDDVSYLYKAEPGASTWQLLRDDLPRNLQLFDGGATPLLSNGSAEEGFELWRVAP